MEILQSVYIFCIGACLGSFMNVLTWRVPRKISIVTPPSSCPACGQKIRFYDNIPIVSWLLLKGRCRFCGAKISLMYPAAELATGVLFLLCFLKFGLGLQMFLSWCVVFFGLAAAFSDFFTSIDTEHFECGIIPDSIVFTGLIVGGVAAYLVHGSVLFPVYGTVAGFLGLFIPSYLFKLIRKKEGMGGGDIKLMAMFGAILGMQSVFFIIFASAIIGAVVGIIAQTALGKKNMMIPFGPFISFASIIYVFYGAQADRLLLGI